MKQDYILGKKKGMAIGQVFIFIVAAITFALIMIFGYQAVSDFLESGEEVQFTQFKTGMETSFKKIYTEYGSVRIEDYHLPLEYQKVCFVDMDHSATDDEIDALCGESVEACDLWEDAVEGEGLSSVNQNVFIKPHTTVPIKVYKFEIFDDNTKTKQGFKCYDLQKGHFSITIEGRGDKVRLYVS